MSNKSRRLHFLTSVVTIFIAAVTFCGFSFGVSAEEGQDSRLDGVVFLGDSTTNSLRFWEALPGGKATRSVWTGCDGTLSMWDVDKKQILINRAMYDLCSASESFILYKDNIRQLPGGQYSATPATLAALTTPRCIVITLGVNGASCMKKEAFVGEYEKLVTSLRNASPNTRIVLNSILPVGEGFKSFSKDKITKANKWIEELAKNMSVEYIDTYSALVDDNGYAPKELIDSVDKLHWNQRGCRRIVEVIASKLARGGEAR